MDKPMDAMKKLSDALNKRFAQKRDALLRYPAVMGDGNGRLHHPAMSGYIYCVVGGNVETVLCARIPATYGLRCWVGYADEERGKLQVLAVMTDGGAATAASGYAPAKRYEWLAPGGGQDPLHVHVRAISFLKIGVSSLGGMYANLYRGFIRVGNAFLRIESQDIDLSAHVPTGTGTARFALVTIATDGSIVVTDGEPTGFYDLQPTDIPAPPANAAWICGAVRLYYGQSELREGRVDTDFVDLRFTVAPAGDSGSAFQRKLQFDLTLADGECVTAVEYIDVGDHTFEMLGDAAIMII